MKIAVLPGDGIGPEIIAEGVKVLNAVGAKYDTEFACEESLIGGAAIDAAGEPLPQATLDAAKAADAVLLAAVGGPKWDTTDPNAPRPSITRCASRPCEIAFPKPSGRPVWIWPPATGSSITTACRT